VKHPLNIDVVFRAQSGADQLSVSECEELLNRALAKVGA